MNRIAAWTLVAIAFAACAALAVWFAHVRAVAEAVGAAARAAGELLDARTEPGAPFARTLLRPGLRVAVVDRAHGIAYVGVDGNVAAKRVPAGPPGFGPRADLGLPPGAPGWPGDGGPRADGFAPPAPAGPGALDRPGFSAAPEPGVGAASGPRPGPIGELAIHLSGLGPQRIESGPIRIDIGPDPNGLGRWLGFDALFFCIAAAAGIGAAGRISLVRARAERRELVRTLEERREAADRYQRFLAETGHELRTPLTIVAGYVDILRSRERSGDFDERIVDGLYAETSRMRALVEKMMALARLDAPAGVQRLIELGEAAREAVATAQRRFPDRTFDLTVDAKTTIVADADDLSAALGNLLENAVRYAPDSPVEVRVGLRGAAARIEVADRGPGIGADDREKIFERFVRGSGAGFGEGLGLGLAIVKRAAERWGGTVDVASGPDRTVFTLGFPLADEEVPEEADVAAR